MVAYIPYTGMGYVGMRAAQLDASMRDIVLRREAA